MGVILVENIVFVAEMANLQMVKFDIIMKEVIPSNSRLVLTSYCCPQGMDFLQAFMLLESLFRNSGHSGNYGFSLQNYSKMYHIQFIQPGKSLEHILMQPAVISNPNRVIFRSL